MPHTTAKISEHSLRKICRKDYLAFVTHPCTCYNANTPESWKWYSTGYLNTVHGISVDVDFFEPDPTDGNADEYYTGVCDAAHRFSIPIMGFAVVGIDFLAIKPGVQS